MRTLKACISRASTDQPHVQMDCDDPDCASSRMCGGSGGGRGQGGSCGAPEGTEPDASCFTPGSEFTQERCCRGATGDPACWGGGYTCERCCPHRGRPQQAAEDPNTESGRECRDQQDNDGDGTMDCEDPDCARSPLCRGAQNGVDCTIRAFAAATSASCPAAPQGKRVPDSCPEACAAVITPWATACTGSEGYTQANTALGGGLDVFAGKCAGGH